MMTIVSIIGFTGRTEDALISSDTYKTAVQIAKEYLKTFSKSQKDITLLTGGGAWCDHIAVELYLTGEYGGLIIHGPCRWTQVEFDDNGAFDWRLNPGKAANHYHRVFSKETGKDSLGEIQQALKTGACYVEHEYFNTRFSALSKCDYMLSFTRAKHSRPEKGAHLDTWKKSHSKKYHISLTTAAGRH